MSDDRMVHFLGAQWQTMCGRILAGPIEKIDAGVTPEKHRPTIGQSGRLLVTFVPVDTTCRRCRGWLSLVGRE